MGLFEEDHTEVEHADYPHTPGTLYDCALCESECFCELTQDDLGFVEEKLFCVHCALWREQLQRDQDDYEVRYRDGQGNEGVAYVPPF
jgi:hypothetical protein